jgi:hypothetical protein
MKKVYSVLFVLLIIFVAFLTYNRDKEVVINPGADLFADSPEISRYKLGENYSDSGTFKYSFTSSSDKYKFLQGFIDLDGDGRFSYEEWMVKNNQIELSEDMRLDVNFVLPEELKSDALDIVKVWVSVTSSEVGLPVDIKYSNGFVTTATVTTSYVD